MMPLVAPIKSHTKSTWTQYVPYRPLSLKPSSISPSLLENLLWASTRIVWIISLVGALPWTRSSPILPLHTRHLSFCANSGRFSQMCMSLELDGYSGQFTMSLLDHGVGHSRLLKIGFQWILLKKSGPSILMPRPTVWTPLTP